MREILRRFGPPVAWMGVIAFFSTSLFGAERTGSLLLPLLAELWPGAGSALLHGLHAVVRKMGHVVEYGILGALWWRALAPARSTPAPDRAAAVAVGLTALYAVLDEALFQRFAPNRSPAALDVAIDAAGGALGVAAVHGHGPLTRAALRFGGWLAAAVSAASLATAGLDWSLGLPAWDLVVAALAAGGLAWTLRRTARGVPIGGFTDEAAGVSSSPRPSPPRARS